MHSYIIEYIKVFPFVKEEKMSAKKLGFTLAEVLITLGIIGIIAIMTIPSLINKINNTKNSTILKEDFTILQQMMLMANDKGAIGSIAKGNDINEMKKWFETYFLPNIKTTNICYDEWGCWSQNVRYSTGELQKSGTACGYNSISFILSNGSFVCMDDYADDNFGVKLNQMTIIIYVDVNGAKQPNTYGKDIFVMVFRGDELLPAGSDMTEEKIDKNCSKFCTDGKPYCGTYCLAKAKKNGFRLPVLKD